ncbi:MAG: glycoside hydrolase family 99-like domain-containing protein [Kiritimatiellae bacterium]|nr:glycoside hydrolase family 99-like domain-containing protein [Kiritimatiellia bacterium]
MPRFIAFYLPQYHPIPENDEWWGPGFTEWLNVARARPLFRGHVQPHLPADLGFYDLRLPETREAQAKLAREAGIEGFCYYHYWFGPGKRLLERPFEEVVASGKPDFPFCLCWANHSWYKKQWDPEAPGKDQILIEQTYSGPEAHERHFRDLERAFRDPRYMRVDGRLLFFIYDTLTFPDVPGFIRQWNELARKAGLGGFYFVTKDYDSRNKEKILAMGLDAIYNDDARNIHHHLPAWRKAWLWVGRHWLGRPTVFRYADAMKWMVSDDCRNENVIPSISPNWDHSPRSGSRAMVLTDPDPDLFRQVAERALDVVAAKPSDRQLVLIKAWNEWGEGNYMEPDLEHGHGYLDALRLAIANKGGKAG